MMPAASAQTYQAVQSFLIEEARLLDRNDWERWQALFTADGIYWMPANPEQTDPSNHVSLIYDDATLRDLRCRRFAEGCETGALSLQPAPRCFRFLSNFEVVETESPSGNILARANVIFAQYSQSAVQTFYAHVAWELRRAGDAFRIGRKRVDLLNSHGPLADILVYI